MSIKPLIWVAASKKDFLRFPDQVRHALGYALHLAQIGEKAFCAKPLKGFLGSSVLELVDNDDGDTYRAVYTTKFADIVFVLHAFQKKSTQGIATPKHHLDLIEERLQQAQRAYAQLIQELNS